MLEECGMSTLTEYIKVRRQKIAVYVATRPVLIEFRQGGRKRGAVPHRWWWEQQMELDINDARVMVWSKSHTAVRQRGKRQNNTATLTPCHPFIMWRAPLSGMW